VIVIVFVFIRTDRNRYTLTAPLRLAIYGFTYFCTFFSFTSAPYTFPS
jgi:hypothetical protein